MSQIDGQGKRLRAIGRSAVPTSGLAAVLIGLAALLPSGGSARSQTAPANTGEPQISGSAVQGKTLNASTGTWSGTAPFSFTYRWLRCDKSGGGVNGVGCRTVPGETKNTFLLGDEDVGSRIRVRVTATNDDGKASATSNATAVVEAAVSAPRNTSPPTITGAPQQGQKLSGNRGEWGGNPTDYNYFWTRCNTNGGSCANISGANALSYTLTSVDVGNTLRFKVQASNGSGSTFASSVPTAVIRTAAAPPPPPATGCPAGSGPINVGSISSPARLLIDQQQSNPQVVQRGTPQLILRYHVTACGGRPVQGALIYATAVPFNQLNIPAEQATGPDGWAELDFRTLAGFPVSPKQQLIALFVRARKQGENVLGGISTRRLFSVHVNL